VVRFVEEDQRLAVDCSSLESPPLDLLDKDQPRSPLGKNTSEFEIQNFELAHVE